MTAEDWADRCATEVVESGVLLIGTIPAGQWWQQGAFTGWLCGAPFAPFNGFAAVEVGELPDLDAVLDRVVATGLPHMPRVRHGRDPSVDGRLAGRGYVVAETAPAMVLADAADIDGPDVPGLVVEPVHGADGLAEHLDLSCEGFGMPRDLAEQVMTVGLVDHPDVHVYVGRVDGRPVTTGVGVRTGDSVGVYTVATPEPERAKGYGAAITAHAVAEGARDGARWAYLIASDLGFGIYSRLGFETVDYWDLWVLSASAES